MSYLLNLLSPNIKATLLERLGRRSSMTPRNKRTRLSHKEAEVIELTFLQSHHSMMRCVQDQCYQIHSSWRLIHWRFSLQSKRLQRRLLLKNFTNERFLIGTSLEIHLMKTSLSLTRLLPRSQTRDTLSEQQMSNLPTLLQTRVSPSEYSSLDREIVMVVIHSGDSDREIILTSSSSIVRMLHRSPKFKSLFGQLSLGTLNSFGRHRGIIEVSANQGP